MKTVGIIVEYNPLHNGHVYHFEQAKKITGADGVIAVMSGHFLQRGEPAVVGKWARAEMALTMGADLVLELPVAFSLMPAEWFAYGAVSALDATGVVDALAFGSESGDIRWFEALAAVLWDEPDAFRARLKERLAAGTRYPAAYAQAAGDFVGADAAGGLLQPNNSLGLHYCMALKRLASRIRPYTVTRHMAGHHDAEAADSAIASATAIRRLLAGGGNSGGGADGLAAARPYMPGYASAILEREAAAGRAPLNWERFAAPLLHTLLTRPPQELEALYEVTEGLEHRLQNALPSLQYGKGVKVKQLLDAVKTKRYTQTKLQRTLCRILLNHRKDQLTRPILEEGTPYLRVLGFSNRGRELLKQMKTTAKVPVITKVPRDPHPLMRLDIEAAAVYAAAYREPAADELFRDYYQAPLKKDI
ncbi:nucleotidyltransferase [Gorillibacterium massiliense]|uniref:nucleotidyltransferase n=1 Tax=Gorillibacterium massiliense TaxID=1280390 RepID=UPI0004B99755|nr:nucleotidyltransferase [Gorillibacterium massiliense]